MPDAVKVQPLQRIQSKLRNGKEENISMNFNWSIQPLARWMCFLGVPPPTNGYNCFFIFYRPFCFLLVVLIQVFTISIKQQLRNYVTRKTNEGAIISFLASFSFSLDYLSLTLPSNCEWSKIMNGYNLR